MFIFVDKIIKKLIVIILKIFALLTFECFKHIKFNITYLIVRLRLQH